MRVEDLARRLSQSHAQLLEAAVSSTAGAAAGAVSLLDHVTYWREKTLQEVRQLVQAGSGTGRFDIAFTHHQTDVGDAGEVQASPDLETALARYQQVHELLLDYLRRLESPDFEIESSSDTGHRNTVRSLLMSDAAHAEEHAAELRQQLPFES